MITTITGKNQVTVPAAIVAEADLRPGTRLDWEVAGEGVLVVRVLPDRASVAHELRGSGRSHRRRKGTSAVANLVAERAREDEETPRGSRRTRR
jgi:bifunctional DNA-binding transcriptional regulator/antitoxin component of YhaV-PrlF toxin-antitoxin module